jgi:hypothetical protein
MAETAKEKVRKRKELEAEFVTEEEIFQYPKALQDRIRKIQASTLETRLKKAKIAKLVSEARYGQARSGKGRPLTHNIANELYKSAKKFYTLDTPKNTKLFRKLGQSRGRDFMRDVDSSQNLDKNLSFEGALQFVFDKWIRTGRIRIK